jgi:hypothetical protein
MVNMTLAIPEELKKQMDGMKFINWSEVAREAFKKQIDEYTLFMQIVSKSKLTQKDADELGRKVNRAASERFMKEVMALRK